MPYKTLDMSAYRRKAHFDYFRAMACPYVGLTANVDITALLAKVRAEKLPFFLTVCYCAARAANSVPEFRQRIWGRGSSSLTTVRPRTPWRWKTAPIATAHCARTCPSRTISSMHSASRRRRNNAAASTRTRRKRSTSSSSPRSRGSPTHRSSSPRPTPRTATRASLGESTSGRANKRSCPSPYSATTRWWTACTSPDFIRRWKRRWGTWSGVDSALRRVQKPSDR